jgi:hypothetical protein
VILSNDASSCDHQDCSDFSFAGPNQGSSVESATDSEQRRFEMSHISGNDTITSMVRDVLLVKDDGVSLGVVETAENRCSTE